MTHSRITRRSFVGAASASAFAFTYLPQRVFGANERLNVASIGVGGKGAGEVRDAAEAGCNIVALCDVDEQRAAGTFKKFPDAKRYTDFRVMLDKQKDIEAVTVSTPDHTHAPASIMAMKLGKHVYCQKPLTHSVYEARLMAQTAKESGVATQMGNQAHAGEPIRRAVELVRAGIIGPVREVHAWTNRPIWPQGMAERPPKQPIPSTLGWDLWLGPAPERAYNSAYVPFSWRGWWDFGTGALGDMACHIMDMPYWALELGSPASIAAESEGGTEESPPWWSTIVYEFPERGSQPPVKFTWYDGYKGPDRKKAPQNFPPESVMEGQDPSKWDVALIGEKGKMYFQRGRTNWVITPASIVQDFAEPEKTIPRVPNEDVEWVTACKGGPAALSNFGYSGPFTEMVLLGNVAIRAGEKIEWDAENLTCTNVPKADRFLRRDYRKGWRL
ncbi:MAG: Gfo/Idh/MocA family oxidoreductase [Planctomycetes bacterium]|nr:Gfo/Idh/MocA family oxidoreductase [Planctomycetota bacterium]